MGRSQRGLRSPSRYGTRREQGTQYGMDSRGETYYPSEGDGYDYNWQFTWPAGSGGVNVAPPGDITITHGALPNNATTITVGGTSADADLALVIAIKATPAGGPIQDTVQVSVTSGDTATAIATKINAALDTLSDYQTSVSTNVVSYNLTTAGTINEVAHIWVNIGG